MRAASRPYSHPFAAAPAGFLLALLFSQPLVPAAASAQDAQPAAGEEEAPGRGLPSLDIYFPEGELDFRINRLINNAFFEGQLRYNFVEGDISAFLRYRYYGYARTYLLSVFDQVEFREIERLDNDFSRVRGGLFLVEWPHSYQRRTSLLAEADRYTSNEEVFEFTTNRTNTFFRVAHQIGTPEDERSNAILGEPRAVVQRLFTAHRRIGPHGAGLTGALTFGTDLLGDFSYVKGELEALKRFDLGEETFLVARVHTGTFFDKEVVRTDPDLEPFERLSIPRPEFFRLDGRDNLKGLDDPLRGTEELHATAECFVPWFLDRHRRAIGLDWTNWYWVIYGGAGAIGFERQVLRDLDAYYPDLGIGFESSFLVKKKYSFFLSALLAQTLRSDQDPKLRVSIKSYR